MFFDLALSCLTNFFLILGPLKKLNFILLLIALSWIGYGFSDICDVVKAKQECELIKKSGGLKLVLKNHEGQTTKQYSKRKRIKGGEPVSLIIERTSGEVIFTVTDEITFRSFDELNSLEHLANAKRGPPTV
jgi:hypothetical protein